MPYDGLKITCTSEDDRGIHWADPSIGIAWPTTDPRLSDKDTRLPLLTDPTIELPSLHT